ncbi:hypothetical protein [Streptomyces sp. SID3212]|uniref:hypothetical protein n=1 Tax=unclassified Streptomyces TaxID=2593676 RepID=UPI00136EF7A1|nr:hypothetical protein [Streptomyces sp. SID3212]MYV51480.1 hypothetical protein [Streptomyces sp. SID3212]
MPSSPSRQDPSQEPAAEDALNARPQHHDIFLEPRYTVELAPLPEDEMDGESESFFVRPPVPVRRRTSAPRRS